MKITEAEYKTSITDSFGLFNDRIPQIAIAGRSNVGKSSFINFLTGNSKLCRVSSAPGRTRMVNFFMINKGAFYFVDLPGYGYAKAGKKDVNEWSQFIFDYLNYGENIKNVFVLIDIRIPPQDSDLKLITMLETMKIPFTLIATKADKVSKSEIGKCVIAISQGFKVGLSNIIVTSSQAKTGKEEVLKRIEQILTN
jgi:GTP-binding protein